MLINIILEILYVPALFAAFLLRLTAEDHYYGLPIELSMAKFPLTVLEALFATGISKNY